MENNEKKKKKGREGNHTTHVYREHVRLRGRGRMRVNQEMDGRGERAVGVGGGQVVDLLLT